MDDEDKHSPSKVNIILNIWKLLMQKLKQESPKARRPKSFFFCRIPAVLENRRSSRGGGGAHPVHPPSRSAPEQGKGNKPQAAQAIDEDEEDALF